jgi:hypothetical protein
VIWQRLIRSLLRERIDNFGEDYCRWMKRGMETGTTSIFLVGCMACAIGERERACGETGGIDRDENGWRRVDVSLMYVGGGEDTHNLRNLRWNIKII